MNIINSRNSSVTNYIIIANIAVFVIIYLTKSFNGYNLVQDLGLYYFGIDGFQPYQVFTSFFTHSEFYHILFNMMSLYSIGRGLERFIGSKRFLNYYLFCGIGASLFVLITTALLVFVTIGHFNITIADYNEFGHLLPKSAFAITIGASGALYGIFAIFERLFPNSEFYLFFIPIAIKAKYLMMGLLSLDLIFAILSLDSDPFSHFGHIGGALSGFAIYYLFIKRNKYLF